MGNTEVNIAVIGAGVVGLAVAEELSAQFDDVVVAEQHHSFGQETSSRHSGVIHAGIYYPPGFMKATFCREGNRLLYERCETKKIPYEKVGKLIVAVNDDEVGELAVLKDRAVSNGVDDLVVLSKRQIQALEPEVRAKEGLFSPSTGIVDAHILIRSFYITATSNGAMVVFNSAVTAIEYTGTSYEVEINGGEYRFRTKVIVNCAGLQADTVAARVGIDIEKEGYRLKYCKGNYFSASPAPRITHLVYPVPYRKAEGLGIHATVDLGGRIRFGPDVEYVDRIEYAVDEDRQEAFYHSIRTYLPEIRQEVLHPDMCGIRPKLQGPGEPYKDFVIKDESDLGYPGFINLIGIESPGMTTCIPMARYVASLIQAYI